MQVSLPGGFFVVRHRPIGEMTWVPHRKHATLNDCLRCASPCAPFNFLSRPTLSDSEMTQLTYSCVHTSQTSVVVDNVALHPRRNTGKALHAAVARVVQQVVVPASFSLLPGDEYREKGGDNLKWRTIKCSERATTFILTRTSDEVRNSGSRYSNHKNLPTRARAQFQ